MADPFGVPADPNSSLKQTSSNTLNQLVGQITEGTSSQSEDLTAALAALAAAINAKPSA